MSGLCPCLGSTEQIDTGKHKVSIRAARMYQPLLRYDYPREKVAQGELVDVLSWTYTNNRTGVSLTPGG